jgi:NIMA (never in mitosis gene a)-related kinase
VKKNLLYKSVEESAKKLLIDLRAWGIKLPDQMTWVHINTGAGDTVCFILNDLLNRELIRLNFKFETPSFEVTLQ